MWLGLSTFEVADASDGASGLWALRTPAGRLSLERRTFTEHLLPTAVDAVRFQAAELAALAVERLVLFIGESRFTARGGPASRWKGQGPVPVQRGTTS